MLLRFDLLFSVLENKTVFFCLDSSLTVQKLSPLLVVVIWKMFTFRTSLAKIYRTNAVSFCSGTFATYCARPPRRTALCRNTSANLQTTNGFSAQLKDLGLLFLVIWCLTKAQWPSRSHRIILAVTFLAKTRIFSSRIADHFLASIWGKLFSTSWKTIGKASASAV